MRALAVIVVMSVSSTSAFAQSGAALRASAERQTALADYEQAADLYERSAAQADTARDAAVEALSNAVRFRLAHGQTARAAEDLTRLRALGADTDALAFEVGASYERQRAFTEAVQFYSELVRSARARTNRETWIRVQTALGRSDEALGDLASATRAYRAAVIAWGGPPPWEPIQPPPRSRRASAGSEMSAGASGIVSPFGSMTESGVDNQNANGVLDNDEHAPVRAAVAEARFQLAEVGVQQWIDLAIPNTTTHNVHDFRRWVTEELVPFIQFGQEIMTALEAQYTAVIELHDPRWEIAAAARLATLYLDFVTMMRHVPRSPDYNPDIEAIRNLDR